MNTDKMEQIRTESDRLAQGRFAELRRSDAYERRLFDEHANRPDLVGQLAAVLHQTGRTEEAINALNRASVLNRAARIIHTRWAGSTPSMGSSARQRHASSEFWHSNRSTPAPGCISATL